MLFAEQHGKSANSKLIGDIINKYYQPGDLILVEESNEKPLNVEDCAQLKHVKSGCLVKGWDVNEKGCWSKSKPIQVFNDLFKVCDSYIDKFPKDSEFTNKEIELVENNIDSLLKEIDPHFKFLIPDVVEKRRKDKEGFI